MAAAGVEFGSHTVSHPILSTLDAGALRRELVESKARIEAALGGACLALAYPNGGPGDYGERERAAARDAGYACAVSLGGRLNGPRADLYALDRININRHHDGPMFRAALTGLLGAARRVRARMASAAGTAPRGVRP